MSLNKAVKVYEGDHDMFMEKEDSKRIQKLLLSGKKPHSNEVSLERIHEDREESED